MQNTDTTTEVETVDVTFTVSREKAEWLEKAAETFGVPTSTLVSLAITSLERSFILKI